MICNIDMDEFNTLQNKIYASLRGRVISDNAKSKEKEYTMDKYLVIVEDGFAIGCTELKDAKDECQKAIEAGVEEVFIYERKLVASQIKPKVEFKEV